jgi:hypothetical protein
VRAARLVGEVRILSGRPPMNREQARRTIRRRLRTDAVPLSVRFIGGHEPASAHMSIECMSLHAAPAMTSGDTRPNMRDIGMMLAKIRADASTPRR